MTVKEKIQEKAAEGVSKMSPSSILVVFILMGAGSGGAGHFAIDKMFADTEARSDITELSDSIRELNTTLREQSEIVNLTRCEVEALRDDLEWLDHCYGPNAPGMRR